MANQDSDSLTRLCPVCKRPVPVGATVCPHGDCKEDLSHIAVVDTLGDELYHVALQRIREGETAEALRVLTAARSYAAGNVDILVVLGKLHAQRRQYRDAIECWRQALQIKAGEKRALAGIKAAERILIVRRVLIGLGIAAAAMLVFFLGNFTRAWLSSSTVEPSLAPGASSGTALMGTTAVPASETPSPTFTPTLIVTASPESAVETCRISTGMQGGQLNMRGGPGMMFRVSGWMPEGESVTLIWSSDMLEWMLVRSEAGLGGWISKYYCTRD